VGKSIDIVFSKVYNQRMRKPIELPKLNCLRCQHEWIPNRPFEPKVCPKCKSPYWNKPKWKGIKKGGIMKPFNVGEVYKRTEIHDKYGGQRQGGISTPAKYPYLFLFTGGTGERYGYKDKWQGNSFFYTGEGQKGDMLFLGGNRAIRDSSKNNEEIHLFSYKDKGYVEYVGQMEYVAHNIEKGTDVDMHARELIIFELKPVG
jgi:hypothetical protein